MYHDDLPRFCIDIYDVRFYLRWYNTYPGQYGGRIDIDLYCQEASNYDLDVGFGHNPSFDHGHEKL